MRHRPLLTDSQPTKYQYQAGDRILVRVSCVLTPDQYAKIERAVKKYTRTDLNVLIVNCSQVKILWMHGITRDIETLVSPEDVQSRSLDAGVANLDCSVTRMPAGDTLTVIVPRISSEIQQKTIHDWVQRWTGKDVEVIVMEGL